MKTRDQDHKIMSILNVNEISRVICDTNMGTLKLRIRKGETAYKFILDAVELPKDLNNELMEAIYPKMPLVTSGYADSRSTAQIKEDSKIKVTMTSTSPDLGPIIIDLNQPKSKGRPKGSKNKVKTNGKKVN